MGKNPGERVQKKKPKFDRAKHRPWGGRPKKGGGAKKTTEKRKKEKPGGFSSEMFEFHPWVPGGGAGKEQPTKEITKEEKRSPKKVGKKAMGKKKRGCPVLS